MPDRSSVRITQGRSGPVSVCSDIIGLLGGLGFYYAYQNFHPVDRIACGQGAKQKKLSYTVKIMPLLFQQIETIL
jgi:hypothetical protein